jgi:DNA polymerase-4
MANRVLEQLVNRYAPAWQNDGTGNIFLDITGTQRLFGSPPDCVNRLQHEIADQLHKKAAAATASNKLVSKVASRTIRPEGIIEVCSGNEAAFLSPQHIALLPGMGPSLMRTVAVTGFTEIGEIAALNNGEAAALFGKQGIVLRDSALGIDNSPVAGIGQRRIEKKAEFSEDLIDEETIRAAIAALAECGGLEMRNEKLGTTNIQLAIMHSDGVELQGYEKTKRLLVMDSDIVAAAYRIHNRIAARRIRVRSIRLSFGDFVPLGYQPDLFEPYDASLMSNASLMGTETKSRKLQEAIDKIQNRYGVGKITKGSVINYQVSSKRLEIAHAH